MGRTGHGQSAQQHGVHKRLRWRIGARDDSGGNHADSPHQFRGRETMKAATRRTIIAAAALTAAGLFGSLPYHGSTQALGVPTEHHDVALVDVDASPLGRRGRLRHQLSGTMSWGPPEPKSSCSARCPRRLALPGRPPCLTPPAPSPSSAAVFNGAESRGFEGAVPERDSSGEDQLNQAVRRHARPTRRPSC